MTARTCSITIVTSMEADPKKRLAEEEAVADAVEVDMVAEEADLVVDATTPLDEEAMIKTARARQKPRTLI